MVLSVNNNNERLWNNKRINKKIFQTRLSKKYPIKEVYIFQAIHSQCKKKKELILYHTFYVCDSVSAIDKTCPL